MLYIKFKILGKKKEILSLIHLINGDGNEINPEDEHELSAINGGQMAVIKGMLFRRRTKRL